MSWLVPISSPSGRAHWLKVPKYPSMVRSLCGSGSYNSLTSKPIPWAKPCENCRQMLEARGKE